MYREFLTTYSDVPLKVRTAFKFDAGFKIWDHFDKRDPLWIGHKKEIEWYLTDDPDAGLSSAPLLGLLAISLLAQMHVI